MIESRQLEKVSASVDKSKEMSSNSDLSDLFSRVPVALYRTDEGGNLLTANQALATLLGYEDVDHLMSATESVYSVYVDPRDRDRWIETMRRNGLVFDFDVELKRADGTTMWIQDTARSITDENGELLYYEGALIDVTEKVRATKAKDEFLATVSHELRNPVAVVVGMSHELAERYENFGEEERRDMIEMIARQAEDASWLIEDLLVAYHEDVSQVSMTPEAFDMTLEVERVLEVIDREIVIEADDIESNVYADPRRTRQIVRNLVNNAISYGGSDIAVIIEEDPEAMRLNVCDSGEKIEGEELEEIFKAFRRGGRGSTHPTSVGLGLPVARQLARLMGGDVTYSHESGYSCFSLTLPKA